MSGEELSPKEVVQLQTAILIELCRMNHAKGWVQQFHFGPMRNVNSRMFRQLGPDTGFDTIGDYSNGEALAHLLDALNEDDRLAKTILYNINPAENAVIAAMAANFQDGSVAGKIQFGSGWWFNDQIDGMTQQMNTLSIQGLLSRFVGMLTDSRSFLSYTRHEYFRRILCQKLGQEVANGEIPNDLDWLGKIVEDISYNNAKNYFKFK
jgi:glucuronate isomerase